MKRALLWIGSVAAAFVGGWAPGYFKTQGLEAEVAQVREAAEKKSAALEAEARRLRLLSQFGALMVDIQKANFGDARDRSAKAFDALRTASDAEKDAGRKQKLEALLGKRDAVTAELGSLNPAALGTVQGIWAELEASAR